MKEMNRLKELKHLKRPVRQWIAKPKCAREIPRFAVFCFFVGIARS